MIDEMHYLDEDDELLLLLTQWRTDPRLDSAHLDFNEDLWRAYAARVSALEPDWAYCAGE
jgi:hypothetical protein